MGRKTAKDKAKRTSADGVFIRDAQAKLALFYNAGRKPHADETSSSGLIEFPRFPFTVPQHAILTPFWG